MSAKSLARVVNLPAVLASLLAAIVVVSAAWWQLVSGPSSLESAVQTEPLVLTAMEHVRRVLFDPTAKFFGVRYFAATKAACGEVIWDQSSVQPPGHTFFVAYPGGFVRLARDMRPEEFLALIQKSCPDEVLLKAATKLLAGAQPAASEPVNR